MFRRALLLPLAVALLWGGPAAVLLADGSGVIGRAAKRRAVPPPVVQAPPRIIDRLVPVPAPAASSAVDFDRQLVTVWGLAGMPWETETSYEEEKARAWMHALHQGYEAVLDIPLMEGLVVRQALPMNPALKERLGMVLLSAPKTFFEPDLTGLLRCRLEVPFSGPLSLRSALYLAALRPQPMEPQSLLASWAVPATSPVAVTGPAPLASRFPTPAPAGDQAGSDAAPPTAAATRSGTIRHLYREADAAATGPASLETAPGTGQGTDRAASEPVAGREAPPAATRTARTGSLPLPDQPDGPAVRRLVLDLRRTAFEPSLFPRFFAEDGHLLFQEAQIPGPERFSRPAIRFTRDIGAAEEGLASTEVMYIAAFLPPLAHRDVKIAAAEATAFLAFCRHLAANPLGGREILIIYGDSPFAGGLLPKASAAAKDKPARPGKTGAKPARR
ncbi:MAG: hypothetical protein GX442_22430 [Candidatus Riflebacteria bacterium]|nr:hypothetical protein [Candidatus Riflebacteria bacterium]